MNNFETIIANYPASAKMWFPVFLLVVGGMIVYRISNYDMVHRNLIQILALLLTLPSIIFCMTAGILEGGAAIGLLGTVVGYAFGVGSSQSSKKEG